MKDDKYIAFDLGSNAFKYKTTDIYGNELDIGGFQSGNAYKDNIFNEAMMRNNLKSIEHYIINTQNMSLDSENIKIVATASFREAKNSDKILAIAKEEFNLDVEILSAEEEARYSLFGAYNDFREKEKSLKDIKNFVSIDIGGRSSEITAYIDGKIKTVSIDFGIKSHDDMYNIADTKEYYNQRVILNEKIREAVKSLNINIDPENTALLVNNQSYNLICSNAEKDTETNNVYTYSTVKRELERVSSLNREMLEHESYFDEEGISKTKKEKKGHAFLAGADITRFIFDALEVPLEMKTFPTHAGVREGVIIDMIIRNNKKESNKKENQTVVAFFVLNGKEYTREEVLSLSPDEIMQIPASELSRLDFATLGTLKQKAGLKEHIKEATVARKNDIKTEKEKEKSTLRVRSNKEEGKDNSERKEETEELSKEDEVKKEKEVITSTQEDQIEEEIESSDKESLSDFWHRVSKREGLRYEEDENSDKFLAILKNDKNEERLEVQSHSKNEISFVYHDETGKENVPPQKYFDDLVLYAQKEKMSVELDSKNENEFNARLYLSLLKNGKVEIDNPPKLDDAFWKTVNKETREEIETVLFSSEKMYEKTFKERFEFLREKDEKNEKGKGNKKDNKDKNEGLKLEEKAEYMYMISELDIKKEKAKLERKYKTTNIYEVQENETGLPHKFEKHLFNEDKNQIGWNIALNVVPNIDDKLTNEISKYLTSKKINHIIGNEDLDFYDNDHKLINEISGWNDAGLTIQVGSRSEMKSLVKDINRLFGKDLEKISPASNIYNMTEKMNDKFNYDKVATYFNIDYIDRNNDGDDDIIMSNGCKGVVKGINSVFNNSKSREKLYDIIHESGLFLGSDKEIKGTFEEKTKDASKKGNYSNYYTFGLVEAYVSHKFYSENFGEAYNGGNEEFFERDIFKGALPKEYTPSREKLDDIAFKVIDFLNEMHKEEILKMQKMLKDEIKGIVNPTKTEPTKLRHTLIKAKKEASIV